jgi:effector-binding domain-containing protein
MSRFRLGLALAAAVFAIGLSFPEALFAQTRVPTQLIDPFGQQVTLSAKPIVYVAGSGKWNKAYDTLVEAFRRVGAYLEKSGLKAAGPPLTIYTSTSDLGFDFQAAVPLAEAPKAPPERGIVIGDSPSGKVLKFVHRGSYEELTQTYEAITNYLDEKGLDAKDLLIEEYVTDITTAPADKLVVNVFVPLR